MLRFRRHHQVSLCAGSCEAWLGCLFVPARQNNCSRTACAVAGMTPMQPDRPACWQGR